MSASDDAANAAAQAAGRAERPRRTKRTSQLPKWAKQAVLSSDDSYADTEALQIAIRVYRDYGGAVGLRKLIEAFERHDYGHQIAADFGVSKQRVSQWRQGLGFVKETFELRPIVREAMSRGLVKPGSRSSPRRRRRAPPVAA